MYYQHRWLCSFLIGIGLILIGYLYDIQPKWIYLSQLENKKNKLSTQWQALTSPQTNSTLMVETTVQQKRSGGKRVSELMELAQQLGLSVQSVKTINRLKTEPQVRVVFKTDYPEWIAFIESLKASSILRFSCQLMPLNQLQVEADIRLNDSPLLSQNKPIKKPRSPFCPFFSMNEIVPRAPSQRLKNVSIGLIKMLGYIQQDTQAEAFVLLPSNELIAISPGSIIGKEGAIVTAVAHDAVQLLLPNGQRYVIRMG